MRQHRTLIMEVLKSTGETVPYLDYGGVEEHW